MIYLTTIAILRVFTTVDSSYCSKFVQAIQTDYGGSSNVQGIHDSQIDNGISSPTLLGGTGGGLKPCFWADHSMAYDVSLVT